MKRLFFLFLVASTLTSTASAQGNRIYVNINNPSPIHDGQSWETAYDNLAFAFFMAEAGDSLWIAAGTYYPTFGTNRTLSFLLKTGVQAYGGFIGNETSLEERDYESNMTLLSGDIGVQGDSTDNTYHVIRAPAPDSSTILDGLYIQYGNADGNDFDTRYGGGLFVSNPNEATIAARINILNCNFAHNSAKNGGAIGFNSDNSPGITPFIKNCIFTDNRAFSSGGALFRNSDNVEGDTILIQGCLFQENQALTGGGAIEWSGLTQRMELDNCTIKNNACISGGGGVNFYNVTNQAEVLVHDCILENNIANEGGGIFLYYTSYDLTDTSYIHIYKSKFTENTSTSGGGAGITLTSAGNACHKLTIENAVFDSNHSLERGAGVLYQIMSSDIIIIQTVINSIFIGNQGGSVLGGAYRIRGEVGTINNTPKSYNTFTNCIFAHNSGVASITSGKPGASESLFLNCTFYENGEFNISKNWAPDFDYNTYYNKIRVQNCIFQQSEVINMRNHLLNGIIDGFDDNLYDYEISHSIVAAPDCDMQGGGMACDENMQYNTLPSFIQPEEYDFRLSSCSPAIDAGVDSLLQILGITEDIGSNPRILDIHTDLGAHEQAAINIQVDSLLSASCPGSMDGAILLSTNGIPPFEYELYLDELQVPFVSDSLAAGDYSLFLVDSMNCIDSLFFTISEVNSIQAEVEVIPSSFPSNGSIEITAVEGGTAPYQFLWDTGDTTAIITDLEPGIYTLTITDVNNCSNIFSYWVDFIDQVADTNQGIFLSYPNPNNGTFTIEYSLSNNAQLYIYDHLGRLMFNEPLKKGNNRQLRFSSPLEEGMYLLQIISEDRVLYTKKMLVKI